MYKARKGALQYVSEEYISISQLFDLPCILAAIEYGQFVCWEEFFVLHITSWYTGRLQGNCMTITNNALFLLQISGVAGPTQVGGTKQLQAMTPSATAAANATVPALHRESALYAPTQAAVRGMLFDTPPAKSSEQ